MLHLKYRTDQLFPVWRIKDFRTTLLHFYHWREKKHLRCFFALFSDTLIKNHNPAAFHFHLLGSSFFKLYSPEISVHILNLYIWNTGKNLSVLCLDWEKEGETTICLSNFRSIPIFWRDLRWKTVRKQVWDERRSMKAEKGFNWLSLWAVEVN